MLRLLLLSACRLREIAHLEHVEISTVERSDYAGPVITIAAERVKGRNGKVGKHAVPVTTAMADVLGTVPKFMTPGRFVFSCSGGRSPMGAFDILKTKVDVAILAALREELGLPDGAEVPAEHLLPRWTFHDLRRTGRSIMSRLGVNQDVAEKVLAHKVSGIRGVYDHHDFLAEKAEALRALSDEIGRITGNNVVPLRRASA
jgi:integrase